MVSIYCPGHIWISNVLSIGGVIRGDQTRLEIFSKLFSRTLCDQYGEHQAGTISRDAVRSDRTCLFASMKHPEKDEWRWRKHQHCNDCTHHLTGLRREVWQCDCVTVWLCDGVTVWQCYCLTMWLCDSVTVWLCDSVTVWQCDSVTCLVWD